MSTPLERFREKFPHKIAEVVDDFGSTVKTDIQDFITSELSLKEQETIEKVREWAIGNTVLPKEELEQLGEEWTEEDKGINTGMKELLAFLSTLTNETK